MMDNIVLVFANLGKSEFYRCGNFDPSILSYALNSA